MLDRIVSFFIHPQLKVDKSVYEKNRVYVLAFAIILGFNLLYVSFYLLKGEYWGIKAFHNYGAILLSISGLSIIKYTGKSKIALFIGAVVGYYLIIASAWLAGGIHSNDFLWFATLSAAAFMFIGIKQGVFFTILSVLGTTFFYVSDAFQWFTFGTDTVSLSTSYKYFNYTLLSIVLTLMVYVLVRSNMKLQEIIQLSKEQKVREEIARDFHDQIGNKLASLSHLAELVKIKHEPSEQTEIVSKIDLNAKEVYNNFRDFIWTLDAKSDRLSEVFMYLRDFTDDYFKFSNINLYITSKPEQLPEMILPGHYSKEIVPIIKEAITNIGKHANAKNVYMDFSISKAELTIRLSDDGKGMDSEAQTNGNGLANMKYRAQKLKSTIEFKSHKDKGTEIILTVLLPL